LEASSYTDAVGANRLATGGTGISQQSWGLKDKILDIDAWVHSKPAATVVEAHREVSFAEMAGHPLTSSKRTWTGMIERRAALAAAGIDVPDLLGPAGQAAADDVLDAVAAAWTAWRVATKTASCLPDVPDVFSDGLNASICY
jgi:predicted RNase H-like nuclease